MKGLNVSTGPKTSTYIYMSKPAVQFAWGKTGGHPRICELKALLLPSPTRSRAKALEEVWGKGGVVVAASTVWCCSFLFKQVFLSMLGSSISCGFNPYAYEFWSSLFSFYGNVFSKLFSSNLYPTSSSGCVLVHLPAWVSIREYMIFQTPTCWEQIMLLIVHITVLKPPSLHLKSPESAGAWRRWTSWRMPRWGVWGGFWAQWWAVGWWAEWRDWFWRHPRSRKWTWKWFSLPRFSAPAWRWGMWDVWERWGGEWWWI